MAVQRQEHVAQGEVSEDMGLLPGTSEMIDSVVCVEILSYFVIGHFIWPTSSKLPSLLYEPKRRMKLQWQWLKAKAYSFAVLVSAEQRVLEISMLISWAITDLQIINYSQKAVSFREKRGLN